MTAHPDGILGLRRESIEGTERVVLSRCIEHDQDDPSRRHLHVCGDLNSLVTGESFVLYEDIRHYQAGRANRSSGEGADLLSRVLAGDNGRMVFSEKTQGQPYHFAILAVAILCEWRFPERALVNGDINAAQCAESIAMLAEHCGIQPALPLLFDTERLCSAVVEPEPSVASIGRYLDTVIDTEDALRVLHKRLAPDILLEWLAREAAAYEGNVTLGVTRTLRTWIDSTQDLEGLIQAGSLHDAGITLTERAWSWIDAEEDLAMLDLLLLLLAKDDDTLLLANLRRGFCEHRDLCRILQGDINGRESESELERSS